MAKKKTQIAPSAVEQQDQPAAEAEIATTKAEDKKKRNVQPREDVKARRLQIRHAIEQVLSACKKALKKAEITRAADQLLGRPGDATSWSDAMVCLTDLQTEGLVHEVAVEGSKKKAYAWSVPVESAEPAAE